MNNMNLPTDIEFYEEIQLIVWRPRGLLNREAVNKVITVIEELETAGSASGIACRCWCGESDVARPQCPATCDGGHAALKFARPKENRL
jgi:hypothetical protein